MADLVYLADFHDWNAEQATEAYMFHNDVQFALNVEPGVQICTRTFDRCQKLFLEDDSTHVFSHMATFGRTKLMAVAIKRFLVQVKRHNPDAYTALPEALCRRSRLAQSQLLGDATDAKTATVATTSSRRPALGDRALRRPTGDDKPAKLQGLTDHLQPAVRSS